MLPESVTEASAAATAIDPRFVQSSVRRLSKRSASTPAKGVSSVSGAKRANTSRPTATDEWVSENTSHESAASCIHMPLSVTNWPVK